jgi:hypothetical protein
MMAWQQRRSHCSSPQSPLLLLLQLQLVLMRMRLLRCCPLPLLLLLLLQRLRQPPQLRHWL